MNGRAVFAVLLFFFWLFLAYRAFTAGNAGMAAVYVAVGVGLTAYRLRGAMG